MSPTSVLRTLLALTVSSTLLITPETAVRAQETAPQMTESAAAPEPVPPEPVPPEPAADAAPQPSPEEAAWLAEAVAIWESLTPRQGAIELPNGVATLDVPESFYYLGPEDAETVLVDVWGNPEGAGMSTLGMLFPSEWTPFDAAAWAVTIEYVEDGYVSDEDADEIDYDQLLGELKADTRQSSQWRVENGYEPIELVGWAAEPFYDADAHKLHWAQELKFGEQEMNTLNYNIRVLGRRGVLVLNFIAGMDQQAVIDERLEDVLAIAEFNAGSRYDEFDPSIDKVAAYGLGGLVAGKVLAKTGLLAAALIFLKKFGVVIVAAVGALFVKLFRGRKTA